MRYKSRSPANVSRAAIEHSFEGGKGIVKGSRGKIESSPWPLNEKETKSSFIKANCFVVVRIFIISIFFFSLTPKKKEPKKESAAYCVRHSCTYAACNAACKSGTRFGNRVQLVSFLFSLSPTFAQSPRQIGSYQFVITLFNAQCWHAVPRQIGS